MKFLKIILIVVVVGFVLVVVFWAYNNKPKSESVCEADSDCDFYYVKWGKDNPCFPCWYSDEDVVCMNKEEALKETKRITEEEFNGPDSIPLCTPCIATDYDVYSCKCTKNKCIKTKTEETSDWPEYYKEIAKECQNKAGSECCMVGAREMMKKNYLLADENENCLEGFRANMNLCYDTLIWCEPIK